MAAKSVPYLLASAHPGAVWVWVVEVVLAVQVTMLFLLLGHGDNGIPTIYQI